eukprot:TRINITY_DN6419_c1_g3_i1.p1 TRINITY_DN6419_c1_g3~~TRINITY_DN6419_c1_g3_i1.p1  ORF type:complete len:128 (-),score=20.00 TRINITY_DN6419_c1_g3_i1:79-462(-)
MSNAVVGKPVQGTQGAQYGQNQNRDDEEAAQMGWIIYGIGCALCWCCGPVGPIFWYAVACVHYCKPKAQRERLQNERTVAIVSLVTAVVSTLLVIGVIVLFVALTAMAAENADDLDESDQYEDTSWN